MRSLLVLVVTEDPQVWEFIHETLWEDGHVVDLARDERDALALMALREYDVVFAEAQAGRPAPTAPGRGSSRKQAARPRQVLVLTSAPGAGTGRVIAPRRRLPVLRTPFTEQDLRDVVAERASDLGRGAARS